MWPVIHFYKIWKIEVNKIAISTHIPLPNLYIFSQYVTDTSHVLAAIFNTHIFYQSDDDSVTGMVSGLEMIYIPHCNESPTFGE